jgi:hypothetical protein
MRLIMLAAASAAAVLSAAAANAQSVEMNTLPPTIVAVANAAAPDVEWSKAGIDVDFDSLTPVYELTGSQGGKQVEIDITPMGVVDEMETEIEMSAVPKAVQDMLGAYLPEFQATMVERSVRQHGVVFYEFAGQHDGREIDVEVSEAGDIIMINDDAAA